MLLKLAEEPPYKDVNKPMTEGRFYIIIKTLNNW